MAAGLCVGNNALICDQAAKFDYVIALATVDTNGDETEIDISGWQGLFVVRRRASITSPELCRATSDDGRLTILEAAAGTFRVLIPATETDEYEPGTYWFQFYAWPGAGQEDSAERWLEGEFIVTAGEIPND